MAKKQKKRQTKTQSARSGSKARKKTAPARPKKGKPALTARTADKFFLYEDAVQNVEFEASIIERFFKLARQREPLSLKEDFCGSFALACEWVRKRQGRTAVGVDLEGSVLDWGRKHHLAKLAPNVQDRITLLQDNVLNVRAPKVDAIAAFNFSYWIFKTRPELRAYFENCRQSLHEDGILVLDAFGGSLSMLENSDKPELRKCSGFTYVWEHARFHPVTHHMQCKIHFRFKDGTQIKNAFVYDWRLWNPPEITELLLEAGFREVRWFFEGTDQKTGEGNGKFNPSATGEACETWIAYAMALK